MAKPSNRSDLIDAGLRVMFRRGFEGAGVRDIVADAGVPLGSFTNHFRSKEVFAAEVLDRYFGHTQTLVGQALGRTDLSPVNRLRTYLDLVSERLKDDDYLRGCLIGDFSIETVQISDLLRERLAAIYDAWIDPFEQCIAEGQAAGEIAKTFKPRDLAELLISSWEGAILRMKVARSSEPLDRYKNIL
jgi:TetR/AcrR family transcriptional repressor of nem operon